MARQCKRDRKDIVGIPYIFEKSGNLKIAIKDVSEKSTRNNYLVNKTRETDNLEQAKMKALVKTLQK